ncbi:MAG: cytochrome c biogenesis CcdA family protein [Acidimicrobiales bacterium]
MNLSGDVGYVVALVGGVLALLSPCGALLLPAFFAYAFDRPAQLLSRTGVFYLGLITTLVPLGVSASAATIFVRTHQQTVITIAGLAIIVLGVITAFGGGFVLYRRSNASAEVGTNPAAVYALGLAYGLTGFCTGPILGSILVLAAAGGQPVRGGLLLAVYALGMVVPLILLVLVWSRLGQSVTRWLRGRPIALGRLTLHSTSLLSGVVLVAVGVFMLVNGGNLVESNSLALAGARAEEWAADVGTRVSDELLAVAALVAAGVWLIVRWRHDPAEPGD